MGVAGVELTDLFHLLGIQHDAAPQGEPMRCWERLDGGKLRKGEGDMLHQLRVEFFPRQCKHGGMSSLPLRLHRAIRIISMTGDPEAPDAQSAIGEVSARIVLLEEALHAVLCNQEHARDKAWRLLATT